MGPQGNECIFSPENERIRPNKNQYVGSDVFFHWGLVPVLGDMLVMGGVWSGEEIALVPQEGEFLWWLRFHVSFFFNIPPKDFSMDFYIPPVSKWIIPWTYRKIYISQVSLFGGFLGAWSYHKIESSKTSLEKSYISLNPGKFILGTQPMKVDDAFPPEIGAMFGFDFPGCLSTTSPYRPYRKMCRG